MIRLARVYIHATNTYKCGARARAQHTGAEKRERRADDGLLAAVAEREAISGDGIAGQMGARARERQARSPFDFAEGFRFGGGICIYTLYAGTRARAHARTAEAAERRDTFDFVEWAGSRGGAAVAAALQEADNASHRALERRQRVVYRVFPVTLSRATCVGYRNRVDPCRACRETSDSAVCRARVRRVSLVCPDRADPGGPAGADPLQRLSRQSCSRSRRAQRGAERSRESGRWKTRALGIWSRFRDTDGGGRR